MPDASASFKRGFVDELAAGAVDDAHARLHGGEGLAREQALGFRRERHVQRDVVALPEQRLEAAQLYAEIGGDLRRNVGVVGDDAHLEGARPLDHFAADAAQTDDAQHLAAQLIAHELLLLPLAAFGGGAGLRDAPGHGEHERQGVLRDGNRVAAGRIHHQHAGGGGGGEIHIVHAYAGAADYAQPRRLGQHLCVDLHGAADEQRVRFRQVLRVFLGIRDDDVPAGLGAE